MSLEKVVLSLLDVYTMCLMSLDKKDMLDCKNAKEHA